jgi:hypothetical protein
MENMSVSVEHKKGLLLELKMETLNQLISVQAEDTDRFLQSTEKCSQIMDQLDSIHLPEDHFSDELKKETMKVLQEITTIREKISTLIPPLYEKIKQKALIEKQKNFAKRRYNLDDLPLPSIFLDKKI